MFPRYCVMLLNDIYTGCDNFVQLSVISHVSIFLKEQNIAIIIRLFTLNFFPNNEINNTTIVKSAGSKVDTVASARH